MSKTVIVITNPEIELRSDGLSMASAVGADVSQLAATLAEYGSGLRPLFGESESRLIARTSALDTADSPMPDLGLERFYGIDIADEDADATAARLAALPEVAGAYVQPDAVPAARTEPTIEATLDHPLEYESGDGMLEINRTEPSIEPAPPTTPDFVPRQLYRAPSPGGIDVAYAWTKPGGRGAGVKIIDCEGAWRFTHEDLLQNQGGVIGTQTSDAHWRNHGTAVASVIGADDNGFGVLGIAPDAMIRGSSIFSPSGLAGALRAAADALQAGDIILIEVQYGHPVRGYTSVEWWPAEHAAIRYAIAKGVIVVEAAANGGNNLDDPIYDTPLAGFPATWSNPFRRGAQDSGAVLVGAGAPPPGTHGRDYGPDRSRLDFSNYGSPVDVQGWGREVTSAGYGDLQGGPNEDLWYSDVFSGTSSASPIVVGTLACVQGALKAAGKPMLTPATARSTLRSTGSPQQDAPGRPATQRIGNRPNLRQILDGLLTPVIATTALYRYWNSALTDHFYTTNWAELGGGAHGWASEGIQCYIFPSAALGLVPLYRYWNSALADHFYTTNWAELGNGAHGWAYEGVQGYVRPTPASGSIPLYRYWNSGTADHFYTTVFTELGMGKNGYAFEGIQCFVHSHAGVPPVAPDAEAGTDGPPPTDGGIKGLDFAQKALMAGRGKEATSVYGTGTPGSAQPGPGDSALPATDWSALDDAAKAAGVTININLGRS